MLKRKILLIFFLSLSVTIVTRAQDYRKFKVGLGLVPSLSGHYGSTQGLGVTLEPALRLNDSLSIGLRIESVVFDSVSSVRPGGGIASFALGIQYYLTPHKYRLFVGGGFASFKVDKYDLTGGIYLRMGIDVWHFSGSADYNFILPSENSTTPLMTYLGIRVGFFVGGGKKKIKDKNQ